VILHQLTILPLEIKPIYPNPISQGLAAIDFNLESGKVISVSILDVEGRLVRQLRSNEYFGIGANKLLINSNQLNSGVYFIHINGDGINLSTKLIKG
jgi:hypothetical protein